MTEPAADLALALAIASAARDAPLPADVVAVGEVGLSGELRRVGGVGRRLAEAARLGFGRALVPPDPGPVPDGLRVTEVPDLRAALQALRAPKGPAARADERGPGQAEAPRGPGSGARALTMARSGCVARRSPHGWWPSCHPTVD